MSSGRLEGKVAFISGTADGQGRAAARLFAAEGAYVIGCDLKSDAAAETLELVRRSGGRMISSGPVDLSDPQAAHAWINDGVRQAGGMDILYNNAAGVRFAPFEAVTPADWSFTLRNALDLVFHTTQAAWPHLIARGGGSIVNTASGTALRASSHTGSSALAAAKGGVVSFSRQAAAEGAPHRIRVNVITPGAVESPGSAVLGEETKKAVAAKIPLGRWGSPEDIAHCALYLASDEAQWVTGANFVVDGGMDAVR